MLCPKCSSQMRKTVGRYQYRECGLDNVWLQNWTMFVCGCGLQLPLLPNAEEVASHVTRSLVVQSGRLDGDAILFLRKAMNLKSSELAAMLKVDRITVSRWENNKSNIEGLTDLRLRLDAIDRLLPISARREVAAELLPMFRYQYTANIAISENEIVVPKPEPDNELVAAAG
jgi:DNA-binding transcriptional regulator YiaG